MPNNEEPQREEELAQSDQDNSASNQDNSPSNLDGSPSNSEAQHQDEDVQQGDQEGSASNQDDGSPSVDGDDDWMMTCRVCNTGDIAYNSMVLGREGFDKYWCNRCAWGKPEWLEEPKIGTPLTHKLLHERLKIVEEIKARGVQPQSQDQKGVKAKPSMVHHIPIKYFLVPILHSVDMVVNILYKKLQAWLLSRVEIVTEEIYLKREDVVVAGIFMDESDHWLNTNRVERAVMHDELYDLEQNPPKHRSKKKMAEKMEEWKADCKARLKKLDEKDEMLKPIIEENKQAHKDFTTLSAELTRMHKELSAMDQDILQRIKEKFEKNLGVEDSNYHGGQMEGPACRKLAELDVAEKAMKIVADESKKWKTGQPVMMR